MSIVKLTHTHLFRPPAPLYVLCSVHTLQNSFRHDSAKKGLERVPAQNCPNPTAHTRVLRTVTFVDKGLGGARVDRSTARPPFCSAGTDGGAGLLGGREDGKGGREGGSGLASVGA